ncbi:MAG: MbcA/ParS/Xre antitoxin family protein [Phyllobacterium sp.]|uniref:MbcA/ParS/Xre antitoxin family protein n=1 Tax=Phyllobacterium sp. TaxID=1871046 RepID=UPI0030F01510
MEAVARKSHSDEMVRVALKAFGNIAAQWKLSVAEAAELADMSESTWKRARKPGYTGSVTKDQMLRISATVGIYKSLKLYFGDPIADEWVRLPNQGPVFYGQRPIDTLIQDGLPQFLRVRNYLDALRGGA